MHEIEILVNNIQKSEDKLNNKEFLSKAPEKVINIEKQKIVDFKLKLKQEINKLKSTILSSLSEDEIIWFIQEIRTDKLHFGVDLDSKNYATPSWFFEIYEKPINALEILELSDLYQNGKLLHTFARNELQHYFVQSKIKRDIIHAGLRKDLNNNQDISIKNYKILFGDFGELMWIKQFYYTDKENIIKYKKQNNGFIILVNPSLLTKLINDDSFKFYAFDYFDKEERLRVHDKTKEMGLSWYGPTTYLITNDIYNFYYCVTDQNAHFYDWGIGTESKKGTSPKSFPILIELPLIDISKYTIIDPDKDRLELEKSIPRIPFPWENKLTDLEIIQTKFIENRELLINKLSDIFNFVYSLASFRPWLQYKDFYITDFKLTKDGIVYAIDNNGNYFNLKDSINTLSKFINHSSAAFDWFENKLRQFKATYYWTGTTLTIKQHAVNWCDKQQKVIEIIFRNMLFKEIPNYPQDLLEIYIQTQFKIVEKNHKRWKDQQLKELPF
jgi:hypothetical protein